MTKLLFFSLSLLMSLPILSMGKEQQQLALQQYKPTETTKNLAQIVTQFNEIVTDLNRKASKPPQDNYEEILKQFNEKTEILHTSMTTCFDIISDLQVTDHETPDHTTLKNKFAKEFANFKTESNNLYITFLNPQTPNCKMCVAHPSFGYFFQTTKEMKHSLHSLEHKQHEHHHHHHSKKKKDHEVSELYAEVLGLFKSLEHAQNN